MTLTEAKPNTPRVFTLCGAYGMHNLGDEAVRSCVTDALRELYPCAKTITLTREPKGDDELGMFDLGGIKDALMLSDALIFGGGSLLQNVTSHRSLYWYLLLMRMAKRCGCKVVFCGCGMGPVIGERDTRLTANVLNDCADAVCLRDEESLEYLRSIGVTKPELILGADLALSITPDGDADGFLLKAGLDPHSDKVCFIVRSWGKPGYLSAVADAARLMSGMGFTPVFAVMQPEDIPLAKQCAGLYKCLPYIPDPALMAAVLGKMRCVVSVRLHGLVLSAAAGTPCVGLAYDPKVSAFARRIGAQSLSLDSLTARDIADAAASAVKPENIPALKLAAREGILAVLENI